jgi:hypothetical protein
MERKIVYFEDIRPENTEATFELVSERLEMGGIEKLVLASTTGTTARKAMEFFKDKGVMLVVIPHQFDFHRDKNAFPQDLIKELRDSGHEVHFGTMLFHTMTCMGPRRQLSWQTCCAPSARGSRSASR